METEKTEKTIKKNGGARPGAGMPKGKKTKKVLEREEALKQYQRRVRKSISSLLNSQMNLAKGCSYLYKIEKTEVIDSKGGKSYRSEKPKLVKNQLEIEDYLAGLIEEGDAEDSKDPNSAYYFITTEKPDNKALDSLLDRTFGKSTQTIEMSGKLDLSGLENKLKNIANEQPITENSEISADTLQRRDGETTEIDRESVRDISADIQEALQ